jgi:hypothetical protein
MNAGAVQAVLFNGPSGPMNPQTLWVRDGGGGLWQYYNGTFNYSNAANSLQLGGSTLVWLTDHFVEAYPTGASILATIFQWSDSAQNWTSYIGAATPQGTLITQIASSQSIHAFDGNTYGPSQLWGIDGNGHILYAGPPGSPPR